MGQKEKKFRLQDFGIWFLVLLCTLVLITLCFDEGLDYDEAYSWHTTYRNSFGGVWQAILDDHDTDIPLWYWCLKVWVAIFGESWFVYKLFSVMGTLATMILGATAVRRIWGNKTAVLFIISVSLSPALLHNSVNVRMYSWTVFLITACGVLVYWMSDRTRKLWMWILLGFLTVVGLFCHYFTAFCYLFLYLFLLIRVFFQNKKESCKVIACGVIVLIPFLIWLIIFDFFHLVGGGAAPGVSKTELKEIFQYLFETEVEYSVLLGTGVFAVAIAGVVLLGKKFAKWEKYFVLMSLVMTPLIFAVMGYVSSVSYHFFTPRHVLHSAGLMWLGIAIVLSRINVMSYLCGLLFVGSMGASAYEKSYHVEYETTPYMAETKALIAERMEPGDIIIFNAETSFGLVYDYYLREQQLVHVSQVNLEELAGKPVWFLDATGKHLSEEQLKGWELAYEQIDGIYGFRQSDNNTFFQVYKLDIEVKEP